MFGKIIIICKTGIRNEVKKYPDVESGYSLSWTYDSTREGAIRKAKSFTFDWDRSEIVEDLKKLGYKIK
jgi:hypothetical protein